MQIIEKPNLAQTQHNILYDFIILGAGISGLQAAEILTQNPNLRILILEAQGHLGGRIQTLDVAKLPESDTIEWIRDNLNYFKSVKIERGATRIDQGHTFLRSLAKQFGIELIEAYASNQRKNIFLCKKQRYTEEDLKKDEEKWKKINSSIKKIEKLSELYNNILYKDISTRDIGALNMLKQYDGISIQNYFDQLLGEQSSVVKSIFINYIEHIECVSCHENSMNEVITKNARAKDMGMLKDFLKIEISNDTSYVLSEGTYSMIEGFANKIQRNINKNIQKICKLRHEVIQVDNQNFQKEIIVIANDYVQKQCKKVEFRGKKIICAVPLAVTSNIIFSNLSSSKSKIIANRTPTSCTKSFLITKKPFWRGEYNGEGLFSEDYHVTMCHDLSPRDQNCGILVFFHTGDKMKNWKSYGDAISKKRYLIDIVSKIFRLTSPEIQEQLSESLHFETTFNDNKYINSGFQSNTKIGTFNEVIQGGDGLDSLYRDQRGIIFVGSEYSLQFGSYVEGAVRVTREKIYNLIGKEDPLRKIQKFNE